MSISVDDGGESGAGGTLSDGATIAITVQAVNDAPAGVSESFATPINTLLSVSSAANVLANDSDVDSPSLTAVLVTTTVHGTLTLSLNGDFTYVPNTNYIGPDSYQYQASDGSLNSNIVTVTLGITDAPLITSSLVLEAEIGAFFDYTLTAYGFPAATFAIIPSDNSPNGLPDGLGFSFNGAGRISGTLLKTGAFTFRVTATNIIGQDTRDISRCSRNRGSA